MDQFDLWQVVPRQVCTPYSHLLISTMFVVVSCVGFLRVTGVMKGHQLSEDVFSHKNCTNMEQYFKFWHSLEVAVKSIIQTAVFFCILINDKRLKLNFVLEIVYLGIKTLSLVYCIKF